MGQPSRITGWEQGTFSALEVEVSREVCFLSLFFPKHTYQLPFGSLPSVLPGTGGSLRDMARCTGHLPLLRIGWSFASCPLPQSQFRVIAPGTATKRLLFAWDAVLD